MPDSFRTVALRPSLKDATPNHALAAELLSEAANAYCEGNLDVTRQKLVAGDIPALFRFGRLLMDRNDPDIAWPRRRRGIEAGIVRTKLRMPSESEKLSLYIRDGWRCRYCGCRVIYGRARDVLRKAFPNEVPWPTRGPMHGGFFALTATPDHVVPHARGGDNSPENLVTSCWPCNFGMEHDELDELGLSDPRLRPAIVDSWDGLTRLLTRRAEPMKTLMQQSTRESPSLVAAKRPKLLGVNGPSATQSVWYAGLDAEGRGMADAFLTFLTTLTELGVSWSVNNVLIVRMVVDTYTVQFFGVQSDLAVQVPWATNTPKHAVREFAEVLAAGIPGAVVRETPKLWNVHVPPETTINLAFLLENLHAVRKAIVVLHARLSLPLDVDHVGGDRHL